MVSNVRKNALSSYLNIAANAVVGLIVNPLLLSALGAVYFGAWKAIQRLLDVGSAANGGAIQSLKFVVAHRSKSASDEELRRDVGAGLVVLLYWSPILTAVTAIIVVILPSLIRGVPNDQIGMIYATGIILGLNVILVNLVAIPDAVLIGTNQGFRSINVTTGVLVATNVGMLGAAMLGLGPTGLAVTTVLGTIANGLLTFLVLRRRVVWWGLARPGRDDIRRLSKFSGWVLGWAFVARLSVATDVIVLSAFAGATFVSSYTFTSYVVVFALAVCQLTSASLMPKLGSFVGNEEWDNAQLVAREARELTLALTAGIGGLVILLNQSFVELWASSEQFMGQGVNILMTIAFVQFAVIRTDAQIQDTGLNIGSKVLLGALMTVSALAAGGAAFVLSGSVEFMYLAIIATRVLGTFSFPFLANRVIHASTWPVRRAVAAVGILAICVAASNILRAEGFVELVLSGLIAAGLLAPVVFFTTLSQSTRRKLLSR